MAEEVATELRGSIGLVTPPISDLELMTEQQQIGKSIARSELLENFVANSVHPRYAKAAELVLAKEKLKDKGDELNGKELNEKRKEVSDLKEQIVKEPAKAKEYAGKINDLRAEIGNITKAMDNDKGFAVMKATRKHVVDTIKTKDAEIVFGLNSLGYKVE